MQVMQEKKLHLVTSIIVTSELFDAYIAATSPDAHPPIIKVFVTHFLIIITKKNIITNILLIIFNIYIAILYYSYKLYSATVITGLIEDFSPNEYGRPDKPGHSPTAQPATPLL